jgi:hypothetical protein
MTRFAHALFALLPAWRPLRRPELPLWRFPRRRSLLARLDALRAELRCEKCAARADCRARLSRRCLKPVASCANAQLFAP